MKINPEKVKGMTEPPCPIFQRLKAGLVLRYGDAERAVEIYGLLKKLSITTPFSMREIAAGVFTLMEMELPVEDIMKLLSTPKALKMGFSSMIDLGVFMIKSQKSKINSPGAEVQSHEG